jgi:hypothetical protein
LQEVGKRRPSETTTNSSTAAVAQSGTNASAVTSHAAAPAAPSSTSSNTQAASSPMPWAAAPTTPQAAGSNSKMSREERKLAAIMARIAKMEEGNQPAGSPTPVARESLDEKERRVPSSTAASFSGVSSGSLLRRWVSPFAYLGLRNRVTVGIAAGR